MGAKHKTKGRGILIDPGMNKGISSGKYLKLNKLELIVRTNVNF